MADRRERRKRERPDREKLAEREKRRRERAKGRKERQAARIERIKAKKKAAKEAKKQEKLEAKKAKLEAKNPEKLAKKEAKLALKEEKREAKLAAKEAKSVEKEAKVAEKEAKKDPYFDDERDTGFGGFMRNVFPKLLLGVGSVMVIGAGIYTLVFFIIDKKSAQVWQEVRTHVAEVPVQQQPVASAGEETVELPAYVSPYEDLFAMNPDMVGWLKIPDTEVDYPVMYTPDDEDHYLNYNFYDEYDHNGCLVLAAPNDIDKPSTNLLIHGHHMRSGAMFGNLADYKDLDFRDSHNDIVLYTKTEERHYEVVGAMNAKVLGSNEKGFRYYSFFDAENQKDVNKYTDEANKYNLYEDKEIAVDFWGGEQLLTLSTCRGRAGGKDRFVLMCKRKGTPLAVGN